MKVVLDTNVLVSATFWSGPSFQIMRLVDENKLELILSKDILKEYDFVVRSNEILEKITTMQQLAIACAIQKILLKAKIIEPKIKLNVEETATGQKCRLGSYRRAEGDGDQGAQRPDQHSSGYFG